MLAGLRGTLEHRGPDYIVIGVGGLSLKVFVPSSTLAQVGEVGSAVQLYTHLYFRADALALYGFATREELEMFKLLLTVSGVGPKVGLSILSAMPPDSLRLALATGNAELLAGVPGIGKKTAARLVVELKGKVAAVPAAASLLPSEAHAEVVAALASLGYSPSHIQRALQALPSDPSLGMEDKILLALRELAPR